MSSLFLTILVLTATQKALGLRVSLYYESLCPDCKWFIISQLYPTYQQLVFDVEFIPYGKAQHTFHPWKMSCQHGPKECRDNILHACFLEKLDDNKDQVDFVTCAMTNNLQDNPGEICAKDLNFKYFGITYCTHSIKGRRLMNVYGKLTNHLRPRLTFVPTIIFNGQFDENIQNDAFHNLQKTICMAEPTVVGCSEREESSQTEISEDRPKISKKIVLK